MTVRRSQSIRVKVDTLRKQDSRVFQPLTGWDGKLPEVATPAHESAEQGEGPAGAASGGLEGGALEGRRRASKEALRRARKGDKDAKLVLEDEQTAADLESKLDLQYGRRLTVARMDAIQSPDPNRTSSRHSAWRSSFARFVDIPEQSVMSSYEDASGARVYVEGCLLLGVRVRMPIIQQLSQISSDMPALICDHYGLSAKDAAAAAVAVNSNQRCRVLSLRNNPLCDTGVSALCDILITGAQRLDRDWQPNDNTSLCALRLSKVTSYLQPLPRPSLPRVLVRIAKRPCLLVLLILNFVAPRLGP